ncbi:ribonuclease T [Cellvibrio japonicus]|uniref:Ribonuclease T n=1 Tax=Cellvibrio japonicus (strain Ueda107) TaxID=498211 RepID=B3PLH0_CELJU|nr:ribonuclease T [Cellvibrio japonicus]ACE86353.1 ribonuclease T [Cellvibrio japonicus Ueda107]QEI12960.1 ribonuclease T [Cellvibrio japonicus]QEI16534.1 ribonuclease T [Cellvibrio japonicus]QEI20112.1 ribonuclease T [Cellvibrio japonicus]
MNPPEQMRDPHSPLAQRFRGFLPVIVDVETGGFNAQTDALLEIAAVTIRMDEDGFLHRHETFAFQVEPFEGANIEQAALDFTGIDPDSPDRIAEPELMVMTDLFSAVRRAVKESGCTRAVMVGHNAHFDLGFVNAAVERCNIKRNPFHPFSVFDTATLAGLAFGQTVLAKACKTAGIEFSNSAAHCAAYDAEKTADLFCLIVNRWQTLGGWCASDDELDEDAE